MRVVWNCTVKRPISLIAVSYVTDYNCSGKIFYLSKVNLTLLNIQTKIKSYIFILSFQRKLESSVFK